MTGYHPDFAFLERFGIDVRRRSLSHARVRRSDVRNGRPGVYIAGTVCGGYQTSRWFIENGRFHARQIAKHIAGRRTEPIPFESIHWKTQE